MRPVASRAIVPVNERIKTCLFRRFKASSSDVCVCRIERGFRERISNEGMGSEEVVDGKREVRKDPMDAMTVSDYLSACCSRFMRGRGPYGPNAESEEYPINPESLPILYQPHSSPGMIFSS